VFLVVRRLIIGPEAEGLFTLFALMFFLIGIALFGIGMLGEYVGRIYQQVRHRPRYLVEAVLEQHEKGEGGREKGVAAGDAQ
jgi:undecaprenyl-phosphate 4-deoxy-4-formamido-L-arabinose transferase